MCREWKGPRGELLVRGSIEGHLAVVYRRIPTAFPENIPGSRILLLSDGIWCWYFVYIVIDRWFFVAPPSSSLGEKKFKVIKMVTLEISFFQFFKLTCNQSFESWERTRWFAEENSKLASNSKTRTRLNQHVSTDYQLSISTKHDPPQTSKPFSAICVQLNTDHFTIVT